MQIRLIGDARDTTGFGLAGIEGVECHTRADVLAALSTWHADPTVGVVLVSEPAAALARDEIARTQGTAEGPIVVVLG